MNGKLAILVFAFCLTPGLWSAGSPPDDGVRLFEQLKKLQGNWRGSSTQGWKETVTIRVIAQGSAILSASEFMDNPGEGMADVFILENGKVFMTHYCEAGNQPFLKATSIEEAGKRVTFEFQGGTNLPSRNVGHMDRVVFYFQDDDHFTSDWSWYANGRQKLFETARYERVK